MILCSSDMTILSALLYYLLLIRSTNSQVPAPKNIQFVAAHENNVTVSIDGIANVSQYDLYVHGYYDHEDSRAWIMTLPNGPSATTVYFDQIDGLKSNRLYWVRVAGIRDGVMGNTTFILVRTAPSGPTLHLAQALPTVVSVFVDETPGATLCEISYVKVGDERSRQTFRSETACRVATIRRLEANAKYSIRARVITCGNLTFTDAQFGEELSVKTAKLSIFGRVNYKVPYQPDFDEPSSSTYQKQKKQLEGKLLTYYKNLGADASEVRLLQFESKNAGKTTIIHHEILIESSSLPSNFDDYSFSTASGTYSLAGMQAQVAENSYSLSRTDTVYDLNFEKSLPCTAHDIRKFVVTSSSTQSQQEVELQGFSLVTNLKFQISGNKIMDVHTFENNSAIVISQNYLLRTCPIGTRDLYYTRYYESLAPQTTAGLENIFVYSTGLSATPEIHSAGIECGNASLISFKRIPNAIGYLILSGNISTALDGSAIDSSDMFHARLAPLTPGANIPAKLMVITKPYDTPLVKEVILELSTLPLSPTHVSLSYHDRFNLTLTWAHHSAALGYFVRVLYQRSFELIRDYISEEPIAKVGNLTPGRRYIFQIIPYNYAGNATFDEDSEYSLYTDQDPPLLSIYPVNVSSSHVTIQWTGSVGADDVTVSVYNESGLFASARGMSSPTTVHGLQPESPYNVTVIATFETGVSQSPLITFWTDPLPPVLSPIPVNVTDTSITIEWTGGDNAAYLDIRVSNATTPLFLILTVTSPYEITGLQPDTIYVFTVLALYRTKTFESNNVTFTTGPASTTIPCHTQNMTVVETTSDPVDVITAVTPHPLSRDSNVSSLPSSNGSLVTRPISGTRSGNGARISQDDPKKIGNNNTAAAPPSDDGNSSIEADLSSPNEPSVANATYLNTVNDDPASSGQHTLDGWAWLLIGMVVAVAAMAAFVLIPKAATMVLNSKAPVDNNSPDNSNLERSGSSESNITSTEAIKMDSLKNSSP